LKAAFLILGLFLVCVNSACARDDSSLCDLEIERVCKVDTGHLLTDARLELNPSAAGPDIVGGAYWRVSYYRFPRQVVAVVEQTKAGRVWWEVYLMGRKPNVRLQFHTYGEEAVKQFISLQNLGVKSCVVGARAACDSIIAVKQILAGHLETPRLRWHLKPGIVQAFAYVVSHCSKHLGKECME
jgi:hypothetical protein